jgi:hypothetical protein
MSRKSPSNPNKITPSKVRVCEGIGGVLERVLQRVDARGRDISNTVVNDLQDLDLTEWGSLVLRNGARKMKDSGESFDIRSIFPINLGRGTRYGYMFNGTLTIVDIPQWTVPAQASFDFTPPAAVEAVSTIYPASYPGDPV